MLLSRNLRALTMLLHLEVLSWPHCRLVGRQEASRRCCCRLQEPVLLLPLLLLPALLGDRPHCSATAAAAAWAVSPLPVLLLRFDLALLLAAAARGMSRCHPA